MPLDRGLVRDVGFDDFGVAVAGGDFPLDRARFVHIAFGDDHPGAGRRKGLGEASPDALAGAGDDHDFVGYGEWIGHGGHCAGVARQ